MCLSRISSQKRTKKSVWKDLLIKKCTTRVQDERARLLTALREKQMESLQNEEIGNSVCLLLPTREIKNQETGLQKRKIFQELIQSEIENSQDPLFQSNNEQQNDFFLNEEEYLDIMIAIEEQLIQETKEEELEQIEQLIYDYEQYQQKEIEYLTNLFPEESQIHN
ncbi:rpa-interacting protein rpain [Anaeramoeba flamelloides]|uniref:Rpa-interacting protein rpain n=1 Tax=Anaeramoeba flamelloides TaxID=1746091 RepID=A0ABQ8ZAC0_9EUKA|nr:rpa-interacting protein rpain [Anaeramoeba flamelloides]